MNSKAMTIVAIVLIALGAFGLARGKFSYTEEKHDAEIAGIELSVKDKETVAIPQWLSIAAIATRSGVDRRRPPEVLMLEMRPSCERCSRELPADSADAVICSFECTFCSDCAEGPLAGRCPNCGGALERRPARKVVS